MSNNWASYGGGIDQDNGTTSLTNVTFSGNASVSGGGIDQGGGTISLINVTLSGNTSLGFTGGLSNRMGTMTVKNTIVTGSKGTNCYAPIAGNSFSLSSDNTCGFPAGQFNVIVALGPLAANGGFGLTHLPLRGGLAIDGGTGSGCPAVDQRGVARPQQAACDVGAVEHRAGDTTPFLHLPLIIR